MGLFPVIQSPCPYKGDIADILDGSTCRLCKREVHDLTALSDGERMSLLESCVDPEGLCVRYSVSAGGARLKAALGAGALGAAAVALPAAAQDAAPAAQAAEASPPEYEDMWIIVGGIREPHKAKWKESEAAKKAPALPVIYEDAPKKTAAEPDQRST